MNRRFKLVIVPNALTIPFWRRHRGLVTGLDGDINISYEEFDHRSMADVGRWVSAHIVLVSHLFGIGLVVWRVCSA